MYSYRYRYKADAEPTSAEAVGSALNQEQLVSNRKGGFPRGPAGKSTKGTSP